MPKQHRLRLDDYVPSQPPDETVHLLDIGADEFAFVHWEKVAGLPQHPWDRYSPTGWIIQAPFLPERASLQLQNDSVHFLITDADNVTVFQVLIEALFNAGHREMYSLALEYPSQVDFVENAVGQIRRFLQQFITPEPDETQSFEILLILRELVTNAILHGNKNNFDKKVGVLLNYIPERKQRKLRLTVTDTGPGYNLPDCLKKICREGSLRERHRGLFILKTFCRHLQVAPGQVAVEYILH